MDLKKFENNTLIDDLEALGVKEKPFGFWIHVSFESSPPLWMIAINKSEKILFSRILTKLGVQEDAIEVELIYFKESGFLVGIKNAIYTNFNYINSVEIWKMAPKKKDSREDVCHIIPISFNLPIIVKAGKEAFLDFEDKLTKLPNGDNVG